MYLTAVSFLYLSFCLQLELYIWVIRLAEVMGLDIIVIRLIGFCLTSIGVLGHLIWLLFQYPFQPKARLFVKARNSPPAILHDKRWGEHKYIKLDSGLKIHYVEKGDHSKPMMVFLHGFPEFWFCWRHQIEHFSKDYWYICYFNISTHIK